jgi:polyhydroxyalkanoate synthesis regulator phasin
MLDAFKRYTGAVGSLTEIPRKRAEQIASALAKQGLISTDQVRSLTEELVRRGKENRERIVEYVRRELPRLGVASKSEVDRLRQRIQALEANQRASARRAASTATRARKNGAAKKRPAKRTGPGRKTAR